MTPNIEAFIKTLRRGKAAYIPLVELGVHPKIKERFLGRPLLSLKDEVDFWYKAGYDYVKLQPLANFNPGAEEEKVQQVKGDGSLSYNWATEGRGLITTVKDFENYIFPKAEDFDYSRFEQLKELLPEGMGVIGQYGDIFTMTWEMMGFEGFSMALFENPELIKALNDKIGELVLSMFEYFAQNDVVDVIWFTDDIAFSNALLMSPQVLHEYFFPWLKRIGDLAKAANKPFMYHSDGVLWDVLEDIIACGVDALHPIEPKAMEIAEVKQRYGDRLCLLGHVDVDLLSRGTAEQVRQQVKHNIEAAGYNGGYMVGSGNSIPDYVNYDNYLAMMDAAREFGS